MGRALRSACYLGDDLGDLAAFRALDQLATQGISTVSTGHAYDNHFASVITIKDRKITHWRDYLDPVAVFDAIGWPAHHN